MFIIAMLILASSYVVADDNIKVGNVAKPDSSLQAQAIKPGDGYKFQVGDTIVISKETKRYLTGEEPSKWVYYVRHIIQQVGGKRFPDGLLIKGIISWIGPEDALLAGTPKPTPVAEERKEADAPAIIERREEMGKMEPEEQKRIVNNAEKIKAEPLEPIMPQEPKQEVVQEPKQEVVQEPEQEPLIVIAPNEEYTQTVEEVVEDTTRRRQLDRFTIGVRGGMASLMEKTDSKMKNRLGYDVLLDLQYAHYWANRKDHLFGLLVGVSAGFAQGGLKDNIDEQYTLTSPEGIAVDYTVKSDKVKEANRQVQLEVPIMFSMILNNGFFLNVGPRLMLPVYTPYKETFSGTDIVATFNDYGVTVPNEIATGKLLKDEYTGKTDNKLKLNILLGLELGYEWQFKNGHSLGLGAYADYGWSLFKQDANGNRLIDINTGAPSNVNVNGAANTFTEKMGYLDAGVKLAYHFNFWKMK